MMENFNPFETFKEKEKKEEILHIDPIYIPFKDIKTTQIDIFQMSYKLKCIKVFKNIKAMENLKIRLDYIYNN